MLEADAVLKVVERMASRFDVVGLVELCAADADEGDGGSRAESAVVAPTIGDRLEVTGI